MYVAFKAHVARIGVAGEQAIVAARAEIHGEDARAENSHWPTRRRERQMQLVKSPEQAQDFLSAHAFMIADLRQPPPAERAPAVAGLGQRQSQICDIDEAGRSMKLDQIDATRHAVRFCSDQPQYPRHARSPGQKRPGRSYRLQAHCPNHWTVPDVTLIEPRP
jgi:hypothetical protein